MRFSLENVAGGRKGALPQRRRFNFFPRELRIVFHSRVAFFVEGVAGYYLMRGRAEKEETRLLSPA